MRGEPSELMQRRKTEQFEANLNKHGPLTREVQFVPFILECTGAFGKEAARTFKKWAEMAEERAKATGRGNYRSAGLPHTWNALKFANLYSQMLSFVVVGLCFGYIVLCFGLAGILNDFRGHLLKIRRPYP